MVCIVPPIPLATDGVSFASDMTVMRFYFYFPYFSLEFLLCSVSSHKPRESPRNLHISTSASPVPTSIPFPSSLESNPAFYHPAAPSQSLCPPIPQGNPPLTKMRNLTRRSVMSEMFEVKNSSGCLVEFGSK